MCWVIWGLHMSFLFFWNLQQCCSVTGTFYHVLQFLSSAVPERYLCDEIPGTRICLETLIEIHAYFLPHGSLWSRLLLLSLLASLCTTALLRLSSKFIQQLSSCFGLSSLNYILQLCYATQMPLQEIVTSCIVCLVVFYATNNFRICNTSKLSTML